MSVTVQVPATTANIGPGFDTFGMALAHYNYLEAAFADEDRIIIHGEGMGELPYNQDNLIMRSIQAAYDSAGIHRPFLSLRAENNIPLSRGMGSSSAAIVGGVVAANALMGFPFNKGEMLHLAAQIEGHPDNVAPALLGGFICIAGNGDQFYTGKLIAPSALRAVVAIPQYKLSTDKARAILPKEVSMKDSVFNIGHASLLAVALAKGDLELFGNMLQDKIHQQYRFTLIPGAEDVVKAANCAGALGCAISGSGPAMIAFTDKSGQDIGQAMIDAFAANDIQAHYLILDTDSQGATIIDAC